MMSGQVNMVGILKWIISIFLKNFCNTLAVNKVIENYQLLNIIDRIDIFSIKHKSLTELCVIRWPVIIWSACFYLFFVDCRNTESVMPTVNTFSKKKYLNVWLIWLYLYLEYWAFLELGKNLSAQSSSDSSRFHTSKTRMIQCYLHPLLLTIPVDEGGWMGKRYPRAACQALPNKNQVAHCCYQGNIVLSVAARKSEHYN